jgi:hypothetical protein
MTALYRDDWRYLLFVKVFSNRSHSSFGQVHINWKLENNENPTDMFKIEKSQY